MRSGIYKITCIPTGKCYAGSAMHVRKRFREHKHYLRRGTHPSSKLLRAWNKYGEEAFSFDVIEAVPVSDLIAREQHYIDALDVVRCGFNARLFAASNLGARYTMIKRRAPHSPETRALMSESAKTRPPRTQDTRTKLAAGHRKDIVGQRFGRLVVIRYAGPISYGHTGWECVCDCGVIVKMARKQTLLRGEKKSCGCLFRETRQKFLTQAAREKISAANKGRTVPEQQREKIRAALLGKKHSPERRAAMSAGRIAASKRRNAEANLGG